MPDHPNPRYCVFELRGPYGTNLGDIWAAEDSSVGKKLKAEHNLLMIWEVMQKETDTTPQEYTYCVDLANPDPEMQDLIRRAREGTKLWLAEQAKRN
jgi:hypothetical protein